MHTKSGEAFRSVENSSIAAVMGRDLKKAEETAKKFGASWWCDSVEELLQKEIDAVYIATPPGLHYEQAMACLQAGKPVYLEKPFARNYTEAKALTEAFEKAGVPLYIAHYRRALPLFLKVRELLKEKIIGEPVSVEFSLMRKFSHKDLEHGWLYQPELSGGGKFYDIAPHTVDIINFLLGNISKVEGHAENIGIGCPLENVVNMTFETEKGVHGTAKFHCASKEKSDRMYVMGTKGMMEFSAHGKNDVIVKDLEGNVLMECELPDPETVEQPMVQTVVEDLLGKGICESKAREVLITYEIIDHVLDKFYGGRSDDFWNYPERYLDK